MAARGEDDRVGDDHPAAPVLDIEAVGAEHAAFVHEQAGDVDVVAYGDTRVRGATDQRPLDLAAGVVAGEAGTPEAVGAEVALREPPVVLTGELRAVAHEVLDRGRRLTAEQLHGAGVGEPVGLAERVGGVMLPAVLGIHRREGGVDAAGGERGVRVVAPALADAQHLHTPLGQLDRGPQAGRPGADHQNCRGGAALLDVGHANDPVGARRSSSACRPVTIRSSPSSNSAP